MLSKAQRHRRRFLTKKSLKRFLWGFFVVSCNEPQITKIMRWFLSASNVLKYMAQGMDITIPELRLLTCALDRTVA